MDAQDIRNLSEAYMEVYDELDEAAKRSPQKVRGSKDTKSYQDGRSQAGMMVSGDSQVNGAGYMRLGGGIQTQTDPNERQPKQGRMDRYTRDEMEYRKARLKKEETDLYDIILSHLLDEGYAETPEAAEAIMVNMSEEWRQDIVEKEDSEYEKASDAALDSRYGYGRATGDKRSFGRAANRSSAAAALRAIRRGKRSGSGTSREAGADAVHQGWARTAKTSADQTPEKKERRAKLANTSYSNLPDDEKEKDRVSFDAVRATYNRNKKP